MTGLENPDTPVPGEGIRLPETDEWIAANTEALELPFKWTRLTGGTSNLTYAIEDAQGRRAVVRRPPTGKLLPKAHDMVREHKILVGVAPTRVPVAQPLALCSDPEVTGAPFYVMEFCEGMSISEPMTPFRDMPADIRPRIGASMVEALATLHALEPEKVGLAELGRPDGYVARQLNRWYDSFQRSNEVADLDLPQIAEAFEALSARIPDQGPARICHGDYAPHNLLISDVGEVVAITDWEIGTLGDPLADFTYFLLAWSREETRSPQAFLDGSPGDGYLPRSELIDLYEERSGRKLDELWFYAAFNTFKSCCIMHGVYGRFRGGVRGTQGLDLGVMRKWIESRAEATTWAVGLL
jgi:aminoglycoside phosphotransferase (APT) family kinase protein